MDSRTVRAYDTDAEAYAREWEEDQASPDDLRAAVRDFFRPGPTVDVGCGSGRDAAWLAAEGFDVVGVDAATGLVAEARRRHPEVRFEKDELPRLAGLGDRVFANVLCETVIMHLPEAQALDAVRRLVSLLAPSGALYLSWRAGEETDRRDTAGRLYAALRADEIRRALGRVEVVLDERRISASSGKVIHRIVARAAFAGDELSVSS